MQLFILEDCEILRLTLKIVFQNEDEVGIAGESDSKGDICRKVIDSGSDCLLIGLRLRSMSGLEITRRLRALGFDGCIVALGYSTDWKSVQEMYQAGVDSFISMSSSSDEIVVKTLSAHRSEDLCNFSITASSDRLRLLPQ